MAEVTRVPLQPIAKGSLTKLWLAIAAAVLVAAGLAWASMPQGVEVETLSEGTGPSPAADSVVFVRYKGMLDDGTVFDQSQDLPLPVEGIFPKGSPLPLEQMLPGFSQGAQQMNKGGKYRMVIPADQAYGANPPEGAPIPPNADLTFEVELVDFMSREDFERRVQQLQQMMAMQQQQQQGAGAPPPVPGVPGEMPPQPGQ